MSLTAPLRAPLALALAVLLHARPASAQCPNGAPPPCPQRTSRTAPPAHSVAVLYFENLSRDTADAYLAEGLTEEITARLAQVERLTVTSRTAVRRLKNASTLSPSELGRDLNAAFLVNGSVRRSGATLRVTTEVLRSSNGGLVWSAQFDKTQSDLLALQEQVAVEVANAIVGRLLPAERTRIEVRPTRSPVAYDYYLRASRAMWDITPLAFERAISGFETALRVDPGFIGAQGRLAYAYGWVANWNWTLPGIAPADLVSRGLVYANRAIEADSMSSDAWVGRGILLFFRDPPDYEGSVNALRKAVNLDSLNTTAHYAYGLILRRLGDFATSGAEYRRAVALEPDHKQSIGDLGMLAYMMRRFPESVEWYEKGVVLDPGGWQHRTFLARMLLAVGDTARARGFAEDAVRFAPIAGSHLALAAMVQVEAGLGDTAAARARLAPLLPQVIGGDGPLQVREGYEFALALMSVGRRDDAIRVLERVKPRGAWLWSYLVMPWFDPMRTDPRFARIVEEARPASAPRLR